ncbi:MAG: peptidylprolyl isomerase [Alphaproteobacteria bacterium]|nr:peptidylprolyl isomerase [Alphaproteobacteria bacterium]
MRTIGLIVAGALLAGGAGPALAENPAAPAAGGAAKAATPTQPSAQPAAPAQAAAPASDDPVVAIVGPAKIHLSDVKDAVAGLPPEYRKMPVSVLFPMMLDQLVDRKALVVLAQKQGLDKDPSVERQVARAEDSALQNALLARTVGPNITEAKIKQRYDETIAGKPGEEEVHARHILVANEADAKKIIAEIKGGADFAKLAKEKSNDPSGQQQGGDLGWFKQSDMLPEFSAVAFSLKPGQVSDTPVHTQYGWHVIKVEERRTAPPPTFDQAKDQLRQDMIQDGVKKVVAQAKQGLPIETFNPDGSKPKATDSAEPPPAAAPSK